MCNNAQYKVQYIHSAEHTTEQHNQCIPSARNCTKSIQSVVHTAVQHTVQKHMMYNNYLINNSTVSLIHFCTHCTLFQSNNTHRP